MDTVKVLLIGIGGYGTNYINELTKKNMKSVTIEGICEVISDIEEKFPVVKERNIPVYRTPEEFYQEHQADLAVISSPIHLHYLHIACCLRNGSNVLTEKPICTSVETARELIAMAEEAHRFVSVGYQLNYSKDVLAMKQDILNGKFGRPLLMKALYAMKRGEHYYNRNNWAGKKSVNGVEVNDSPFNNACAHQFQNMTFLLGKDMDSAAELIEVEGELYRANDQIENYDTVAVAARTNENIPLYYYTTHSLKEKKIGPFSEYQFEHATIYYGKDFGKGSVMEYVVEWEDGMIESYGGMAKGERLQKLYDAIECVRQGGHPVCTIQCAIPHLQAVERLAKMPVWPVSENVLEHVEEDGERFCRIQNLKKIFTTCYINQQMPSQAGGCWKKEKGEVTL